MPAFKKGLPLQSPRLALKHKNTQGSALRLLVCRLKKNTRISKCFGKALDRARTSDQVLHEAEREGRHLLPEFVDDRLQRKHKVLVLDLVHELEELVQQLRQDRPQQVQVCKGEVK